MGGKAAPAVVLPPTLELEHWNKKFLQFCYFRVRTALQFLFLIYYNFHYLLKMRSRSSGLSKWVQIVSDRTLNSVSYKKSPDTVKDVTDMIGSIVHLFVSKGERYFRVSQSYQGVGHTFGIVITPTVLYIYDVNANRLYNADKYRQYNLLIDGVYDGLLSYLPDLENIVFAPRNPAAEEDPEFQRLCVTLDGLCVYYIDNYVVPEKFEI